MIGWTKTYGKARIVYLQSGHDHFAYENPNYQKILAQAIRWVAKRD
ncbi:MAG: ThuA domain-containing protein [Limisphaerales bacterium]